MPPFPAVTASLRQQMHDDLAVAMRARDTTKVGVLRTTLSALANAEAVSASDEQVKVGLLGDVARRHLSDDDMRAIIEGERADLAATAAEMRAVGQAGEADELEARVAVLDAYLG